MRESDIHMGQAWDLVKNLALEQIHRVVLNSHLGVMGATAVTWYSTGVGLTLEEHASNGGASVIVHGEVK